MSFLKQAIQELLELLESHVDLGSEEHKLRFAELTVRIDQLGASLPATERLLKHYLTQHSYSKASRYLDQG